MSFPTSPTDGDIHQQYVYNGTVGVWDKMDPSKYYPIGFIYVQFPSQSSPGDLGWYGTWTNVSSTYAGDFFRAEGGDASAFGGGEQLDQMQGHYHKLGQLGNPDYYDARNWCGGSSSDEIAPTNSGATTQPFATTPYNDQTNGEPRTGSETRPVNQTVRVWKRTA